MPTLGPSSSKEQASSRFRGTKYKDQSSATDKIEGKPLPSNLDAEQGLLAACILDTTGEIMGRCAEQALTTDHFYHFNHQVIYESLLELNRENKATDEILLAEKLESKSQLEQIGGQSALFDLTSRIDTTAHATYWLELVKEKALLRRCIYVAFEIIDGANNLQGEVDDFLSGMEQKVCELGDDQNIVSSVHFKEPIQRAMGEIQKMLSKEDADGLLTGYKDLDNLTNGLKAAEMVVVAARPSVGKTSLAMNIVENIAFSPKYHNSPKNTLVFSLEMSASALAMRLICGKAKVNMNDLRKGFVAKNYAEKLNKISQEFQKAPIWVDDTSGLTINQIRAKARRVKSRNGLSLIVVDYLQLISGDRFSPSRENEISQISRGLKSMAKELEVPVIVLSQLNRDSEKEKRDPRLSDLRESGSIEQDADIVMLLGKLKKGDDIRESDISPSSGSEDQSDDFEHIKLILAKQRNGPTGYVNLAFIRKYTRFESMLNDPRLN
ncbi:MAG: replicative DNA helicase [Opitutae bacterium]|nr:replicative DNA helicase [Opitutae bacterium]|tara:strand:+ start:2875 stop:4359 length:1485 start_codon:yes stop_codon:yes gene_type:complete